MPKSGMLKDSRLGCLGELNDGVSWSGQAIPRQSGSCVSFKMAIMMLTAAKAGDQLRRMQPMLMITRSCKYCRKWPVPMCVMAI